MNTVIDREAERNSNLNTVIDREKQQFGTQLLTERNSNLEHSY